MKRISFGRTKQTPIVKLYHRCMSGSDSGHLPELWQVKQERQGYHFHGSETSEFQKHLIGFKTTTLSSNPQQQPAFTYSSAVQCRGFLRGCWRVAQKVKIVSCARKAKKMSRRNRKGNLCLSYDILPLIATIGHIQWHKQLLSIVSFYVYRRDDSPASTNWRRYQEGPKGRQAKGIPQLRRGVQKGYRKHQTSGALRPRRGYQVRNPPPSPYIFRNRVAISCTLDITL